MRNDIETSPPKVACNSRIAEKPVTSVTILSMRPTLIMITAGPKVDLFNTRTLRFVVAIIRQNLR